MRRSSRYRFVARRCALVIAYSLVSGYSDYPLYAPVSRQLALLYGQRSTDDPKAYELVMKARQAYPDDPEIAKALGILNYRRGYYPQSADLLKEAAARRKDDPELLYRQLKQWKECEGALQRSD